MIRMTVRYLLPLFLAAGMMAAKQSHAQSLSSLVDVQGVRGNQLVGYSLVVGLDGTGDRSQVKFTGQSLGNMLRQFGVQMPAKWTRK